MERGLGQMNKVNSSLRRGFLIKTIPWGTRIRFPTKILKDVATHFRGLDVLLVGSNTWVVFWAWMVVLDVVIKFII